MQKNWPPILYFGNDYLGDNRTSSHHIAKRLMSLSTLVYIECPGLRAPQRNARDLKKIIFKTIRAIRGVEKVNEKLFLCTLFQIPLHKYRVIRIINKFLVIFSLTIICKKLKIKNPILWFVVPHLSFLIGKLNANLVVYYCIDDYASLPGVDKKTVQIMDEELTKKADIVFVSSIPLLERKKQYNKNTRLSRHGVDFDHFNQVFKGELEVADEVKLLGKPVIGFFGLIESWVDLELIKFIAESKPEWNILMIGRLAVKNNPCKRLPNVHFIGSRKYEILPKYAKVFDVAVIPCKIDNLIVNFNPLKLREYLAMGKPVVSIRFPEINEFLDVAEVADSYEEFLQKIEFVIKNDSLEKARMRVNKVKDSSWEKCFAAVSSVVESKLDTTKINLT